MILSKPVITSTVGLTAMLLVVAATGNDATAMRQLQTDEPQDQSKSESPADGNQSDDELRKSEEMFSRQQMETLSPSGTRLCLPLTGTIAD